jgi:spermidine/putrescine transport system substrate-binding protein
VGWCSLTFHPRQRVDRRSLLKGGVGLGVLAGLGPTLSACADRPLAAGGALGTLPRPDIPVTWPTYADNAAIASGLPPERNATLKVFNWVAYINKAVVKNFEAKYNCNVEITTFNTMEDALAKLNTGDLAFDVFVPTVDVIGPLVAAKQIRPLNHSYIPNIHQAWREFSNPFYDQQWKYTVPYTIYTTGISWRNDHVPGSPAKLANPWSFLWQPQYKGKVAILDDYRESMGLGLMKNGYFDLNTADPNQLATAQKSLLDLAHLTDVHIDNNDYTNIPSGQMWIHHSWSGDMAAAAYYMPKGVSVDTVSYWFPADGKGPVNNDTMAVLAGGKNPVLAHLFLNYFMDLHNVLENISYNGYMQPIYGVTPQRLVKEKLLPPNLVSTVVLESYFSRGLRELQISASAKQLWQQNWLNVSKGV